MNANTEHSKEPERTRQPGSLYWILRRIEDRGLQELVCSAENGQRVDPAIIQKALNIFRPNDPKTHS